MSARMQRRVGAVAAALMLTVAATPGHAVVIASTVNEALSAAPVTVGFGGGAASYDFTAVPASVTGIAPGAAVATGGTGLVSTLFGGVTDFGASASIDGGELFSFAAYPAATLIPNSPADDFIGLAFTLGDGLHYGYAEVDGALLVGYGYETVPGATILTGARAVAEPGSMALLAAGLAALGTSRRRRPRGLIASIGKDIRHS